MSLFGAIYSSGVKFVKKYINFVLRYKNDSDHEKMNFKNIELAVKDVDLAKRTIVGYANTFNFKDSAGDITQPGAFSKTIAESGPAGKNRIFHLWQHDSTQIIGKPTKLEEDSVGLLFETPIRSGKQGDDILTMYNEGLLTEHSIGYNVVKSRYDQALDANLLIELKLWEFSTVTWGANEQSLLVGLKSAEKENRVKERIQKILKAMRDGKYSDDTFELLTIELKILENMMLEIIKQPDEKPLEKEPESTADIIKAIRDFKTNLKTS